MNIKCKCGRTTNYGTTCTFCRTSFDLDPDSYDLELVIVKEEDVKTYEDVDTQLEKEYGKLLGLEETEK